MKLSPRIFLLAIGLAVLSLRAEPTPAPTSEEKELELPVPVGIPVNGIKVPHYNSDGELELVLEAETAQKIDEQNVSFTNLKLEAHDDEDRKIFVDLPQAVLNLDTRILTGDQTVHIRREDFTISGDRIEFNTKTRFGTLKGNISMVISSENTNP
ncbi:MAG: LPS export ABC transporter periplasmic protein LptC [Terrimicrobiaceae bacterium]